LALKNTGGALITQIAKDSAAARAGLRAGDIVTALNGRNVKSAAEFRNAIGLLRVGEKVEITLLRDGQNRKITAEVADPSTQTAGDPADARNVPEGSQHPALEGAQLEDGSQGGVLVRAVAPGSPAANAGLRANDVIVAANGVRLSSSADLSATWRASANRGGSTVVLQIRRGGETAIVLLR
jgi:serine protease Do/serine protease DegQ